MLPDPIVLIWLWSSSTPTYWTPYVEPIATWAVEPVLEIATAPPPGLARDVWIREATLAARVWGLPACSHARLLVRAADGEVVAAAGDGKSHIVVHADTWPTSFRKGAIAQTVLVTTADAHVIEADVHVNAVDFRFSIGDQIGHIDLRAVLTHEFGHVLGLGHSSDVRATMNAGLPPGIAARSLEADDIAGICAIYATSPVARDVGCDRIGCPIGTECRGKTCEIPDEKATPGSRCADDTLGRRCEGAGDESRCVRPNPNPDPEICAVDCSSDAATCGNYFCVPQTEGGAVCLAKVPDVVGPKPVTPADEPTGCALSHQAAGQRVPGGWLSALIFVLPIFVLSAGLRRRRATRIFPGARRTAFFGR